MAEPKRASLTDVLNYEPEQYFSEDELMLIRNTFRSPVVINLLRKVFIPTISDPELPLEDFGNDMFLAGREYAQIPDGEIKSIVLARQDAIKFIMGALVKLKVIANTPDMTPEQKKLQQKQNSGR